MFSSAMFSGVVGLGVNALRTALLAVIVVAGCGGPPSAPAEVAPSTRPRALSSSGTAECRIEAARADDLSVAAPGRDPFPVAISDGLLALVPTDDGRLSAHVEHPLRFHAEASVADQRLVLLAETDFAAGAVHATGGASIVALARSARGLTLHLALGARSPSDPRGIELVAGPLEADCDEVGPRDGPRSSVSLPRRIPGGELRVASALPLVLRPVRAAPTSIELRPRDPGGFVPLWMLDRQGEDARVAMEFSDGARVSGWVPLVALREPSAEEAERVDRAVTSAPTTVGLAELGMMGEGPEPLPIEGYIGPASLRPSSAIAAAPGEAPWATSAASPLEVEVRWLRGASHVELLEIPGMWIPTGRAWAERGDVAIPTP